MTTLSESIKRVKPSMTLAASTRAQELKQAGRDIISLTVGEPDFDTPQHIKDAAIEAMKRGFTKYTAVGGIASLKEAIVKKFKTDQNLEFKPNEILVTNGGKQALAAACAVLLNPGDEAIITAPYWTSYPDMVRMTGAEAVIVNASAQNGYRMTPDQLAKAITPKTKIIFFNSPSNPTGACYSLADLRALLDVIKAAPNAKEITVISDEVYEYITYEDTPLASPLAAAPEMRDQIMIVNAFSKAYSMTGWRVGYAAGPKAIIDAMNTHQSQFTTNVCSIAQHAAAAAYADNYAFPKMMRGEFRKRLDMVCNAVEKMPNVELPVRPQGAFYGFLRVEGLFGKRAGDVVIKSGGDVANYLLEKFDVAVVQGEAFGDAGAIRMSFALDSANLEKALARITEAVQQLQ